MKNKKGLMLGVLAVCALAGTAWAYASVGNLQARSSVTPGSAAVHQSETPEIREISAAPQSVTAEKTIGEEEPLNTARSETVSAVSQTEAAAPLSADMLTVSPAEQPAPGIAPAGAGGVPFTSFTLTAGSAEVSVHSVTVRRTGAGADGAFDSIALNDPDGNQIGDEKSFHTNHEVVFDEPFVIPAHASEVFTVVGTMADDTSGNAGEMPTLSVTAIDATAPVSGTLPIVGTAQTVNDTLVIGGATATRAPEDPGGDVNRYINDTGVRFSGIRLTASATEDITLSSITWTQNGSAAAGDLANIATTVNGVSYPTDTDDKTYTSTFSPGIVIKKGEGADIYVAGDLTGTGANRTVKFDIDSSGDIALTGNSYGFGVGVSAGGYTASEGDSVFITSDGTTDGDEGTPFFSGSLATVHGATITSIGKD